MTKAEQVRDKIIKAFTDDLNHHIFSEKAFPQEVTIKTVYKECIQTLTINFENITED